MNTAAAIAGGMVAGVLLTIAWIQFRQVYRDLSGEYDRRRSNR